MRRKLSVILFFIVISLGILVHFGALEQIDGFVYHLFINIRSRELTAFFKTITFLGNPEFIIFLNIVIVFYSIITKKLNYLIITVNSLLSVVVNNTLKLIFKRNRPVDFLVYERSYSFPSGHAMITILFYGTIILLLKKSKIKYKQFIINILWGIMFLIAISRIYLGAHYLSDVIAGLSMGLSLLFIKEESDESINNRSNKRNR